MPAPHVPTLPPNPAMSAGDERVALGWSFSPSQWQALRQHLAQTDRQLQEALHAGDAEGVRRALSEGGQWTQTPRLTRDSLKVALGHQSPALLEALLAHSHPEQFVWSEPLEGMGAHQLVDLALEKEAPWAIPALLQAGVPLGGCKRGSALHRVLSEGDATTLDGLMRCPEFACRWQDAKGQPLPLEEHPLFVARTPEVLARLWDHWGQDPACLWACQEDHPWVNADAHRRSLHNHLAFCDEAMMIHRKEPGASEKEWGWVDVTATVAQVATWGEGWSDRHLAMACWAENGCVYEALDQQGLDWHWVWHEKTALDWLKITEQTEAAHHWTAVVAARDCAKGLTDTMDSFGPHGRRVERNETMDGQALNKTEPGARQRSRL